MWHRIRIRRPVRRRNIYDTPDDEHLRYQEDLRIPLTL